MFILDPVQYIERWLLSFWSHILVELIRFRGHTAMQPSVAPTSTARIRLAYVGLD
jgi:hypothetical protein